MCLPDIIAQVFMFTVFGTKRKMTKIIECSFKISKISILVNRLGVLRKLQATYWPLSVNKIAVVEIYNKKKSIAS